MSRSWLRLTVAPRDRRFVSLALAMGLVLLLPACGGGDDNDPTAVPTSRPGLAPTSAPIGSPPPANRPGTVVSDGICQARLPAGWVEEAAGSGSTASGNRFAVYGNRLNGESAWTNAASLFTTQLENAGATVEEGDGWVRATYPDGRGFAYRARFDDRWCDVRLTARSGALPEVEAQAWEAIEASLGPAG
jgi:hypothetical protein